MIKYLILISIIPMITPDIMKDGTYVELAQAQTSPPTLMIPAIEAESTLKKRESIPKRSYEGVEDNTLIVKTVAMQKNDTIPVPGLTVQLRNNEESLVLNHQTNVKGEALFIGFSVSLGSFVVEVFAGKDLIFKKKVSLVEGDNNTTIYFE